MTTLYGWSQALAWTAINEAADALGRTVLAPGHPPFFVVTTGYGLVGIALKLSLMAEGFSLATRLEPTMTDTEWRLYNVADPGVQIHSVGQ